MAYLTLKDRIREDFVNKYSSVFLKNSGGKQEISSIVREVLKGIVSQPRGALKDQDRERIINELVDEFSGLGPIETLMMDPEITEIMINGTQKVYAEKHGKKKITDIKFDSDQQLMYVIQKILAPTRRR